MQPAVKLDGYVLDYIVNDKSVFVVLFLFSLPYFIKVAHFPASTVSTVSPL